jgi:hypothetical protein
MVVHVQDFQFICNLILLNTLTGCVKRDTYMAAIFKILIAVFMEFYIQVGMSSCDVGQIVSTIFRKLSAVMTS